MAIVQKPIAIPEPINQVDSLWRTTQALKEAVEVIQGVRGNREYALQCDLDDAVNAIDANDGCCTWVVEDFPVDPLYWSEVQFLAEFEGADAATAYTEVSTNAAVATFVANAQLDTAQFNFGTSSLLLDGNGDFVTFPDLAAYDLAPSGAQDWTIECFVRFNSVLSNPQEMEVAGQFGAGGNAWAMGLMADGFSTQRLRLRADGLNEVATVDNTTIVTGVWYHFVMERQGDDFRAGFNGYSEYTGTNQFTGSQVVSSELLRVGSRDGLTALDMFDGHIDDMRITIGTARYDLSQDYTVPTSYEVGGSSSYTLVPADSGKIKRSTGVSATSFTVAPDVFSIGEQVVVFQSGVGAVTIVAGSGVTIRTPSTLLVNEQYGSITLILLAANEWMIAGRMTP